MTEQKTVITCDQLGNFLHEMWMDVLNSESVLEIELKLDMLGEDIGDSLAPCVGKEVLNNTSDDWDSVSKVLDALKTDAKDKIRTFHREGADDPTGDKYSQMRIDLLMKRVDQIGKVWRMPPRSTRKCPICGLPLKLSEDKMGWVCAAHGEIGDISSNVRGEIPENADLDYSEKKKVPLSKDGERFVIG